MLPDREPLLIKETEDTEFLYPRSINYPLTESWDNGGKDLGDLSEELTDYVWKAWTDGKKVYLQRVGLDVIHTVLEDEDITEIDVTFDQNMRPCVAYYSNDVSKLFWYDTSLGKAVTTSFSKDILRPRVSLDDKRRFNVSNSDILFFYQRDKYLCYRLQRERFTIEHVIFEDTKYRFLWKIGMGTKRRFLIHWR